MAAVTTVIRTQVQEDEEKSTELKMEDTDISRTKATKTPSLAYNRRASATDASIRRVSEWRLLDLSQLPSNICWLSKRDRMLLYHKVSKNFTIVTTNNNEHCESVKGLPHRKLASLMTPNGVLSDVSTLFYIGTFQLLYFLPLFLTCYGIYLFIFNYCYTFYAFTIVYLILLFYPHKEWSVMTYNPFFFEVFKYFSYRIAYHPETQKYMLKSYNKWNVLFPNGSNKNDNNTKKREAKEEEKGNEIEIETYPQTIHIAVPHGVQPLATTFSPLVMPDIYGEKHKGAGATIVLQLPIIRAFFLWWGLVEVTKGVLVCLLIFVSVLFCI